MQVCCCPCEISHGENTQREICAVVIISIMINIIFTILVGYYLEKCFEKKRIGEGVIGRIYTLLQMMG